MAERSSTKLLIPHSSAPECSITGVLEQLDAGKSTHGRKIAIILHGSMGHKDYLFQRRLAQRLSQDSFRFDFRGNHESPGVWCYGAFQDDVDDLCVVVQYLQTVYGYVVDMVVGHSRGSIVGMRWLCTAPEARNVTNFINASGRYRMNKVLESEHLKIWQDGFAADGYYDWTTTVARKPVTVRVHPADVDLFVSWDTSLVWDKFPANIHVLTIHGLSDKTVPPCALRYFAYLVDTDPPLPGYSYDALIYARALGTRSPGTHTLHMVEDADHNFTGNQDQLVDYMLEWRDLHEQGELKSSGLWKTGVRGKL
ncbi:ectomycorrhiza-regulated esterase [Mycena maculata]|uniref:Ectomycorrhiza-regulated esterase n=1 Tax=Mycena maculata TaxID=230809 RepID=A0AAD7JLH3_9AGAR|nr:ectomycorrhiza-regulated esterase [Mycena maculata]